MAHSKASELASLEYDRGSIYWEKVRPAMYALDELFRAERRPLGEWGGLLNGRESHKEGRCNIGQRNNSHKGVNSLNREKGYISLRRTREGSR